MTIVACSKKERKMIADTLLADGDCRVRSGYTDKIFRCSDGSLVGAAGDSDACWAFIKWAQAGRTDEYPTEALKESDKFEAVILTPAREILVYNSSKYPDPMIGDTFCIGAGSQFAMGALYAGASLEEAVKAAVALSTLCGGKLTTLILDKR